MDFIYEELHSHHVETFGEMKTNLFITAGGNGPEDTPHLLGK